MLSDPLSSTSVSTQQDQQLNFCPKTIPIFQLSTLEDPSHLRLLWVGSKLCLNPRRMTSGKDTWTSPCRTKPHTATQAPDCKRKWGFGQLFLEQHDSALISWNNPFDWERLRSQFFQVWLSAPASQLWRSTITAGSKNHRMLIFHGKKITYIQETLPGCYFQVNRWYSSRLRGRIWGWILPPKHPAESSSLLAWGKFVSGSQCLSLEHPSPFPDVAIYPASSQHTDRKGRDHGRRSEISVTAR